MKIGDKFVVTGNFGAHLFNVGETVRLVEQDTGGDYLYKNKRGDSFYVESYDLIPMSAVMKIGIWSLSGKTEQREPFDVKMGKEYYLLGDDNSDYIDNITTGVKLVRDDADDDDPYYMRLAHRPEGDAWDCVWSRNLATKKQVVKEGIKAIGKLVHRASESLMGLNIQPLDSVYSIEVNPDTHLWGVLDVKNNGVETCFWLNPKNALTFPKKSDNLIVIKINSDMNGI